MSVQFGPDPQKRKNTDAYYLQLLDEGVHIPVRQKIRVVAFLDGTARSKSWLSSPIEERIESVNIFGALNGDRQAVQGGQTIEEASDSADEYARQRRWAALRPTKYSKQYLTLVNNPRSHGETQYVLEPFAKNKSWVFDLVLYDVVMDVNDDSSFVAYRDFGKALDEESLEIKVRTRGTLVPCGRLVRESPAATEWSFVKSS